jgi:ATP-binding cassette subfamily B protein
MKISTSQYLSIFWKYLRPQGWKAVLLAVLLLSSIGTQLATPQLLRTFIDNAQAGAEIQTLLTIAGIFLVAGLANQLLSAYATYVGADVGWSATNLLRSDLAQHLLRLDMSFHNDRTPGELVERIDGDVTALANFFSRFFVRVAGSLMLLIGILVLLYLEDWRVGLALTLYTLTSIWALNKSRDLAVGATSEEREGTAKVMGFIEERLAGLDDIRANGGAPFVLQRFYDVTRRWYHYSYKAWMQRSLIWILAMSLFSFGDVLAFGMGVWLFTAGAITLGTVYLFYQYTNLLVTPLEQITQEMQELQKAGAGVGRVAQLLQIQTSLKAGQGTPLPVGALSVEFEDVAFSYTEEDTLLKDVTLTIPAGKVVGLLGRTGSGKSSLTRLLFRLYDPTQGVVRLGGVDLRDPHLHELRHRISMVTQDVQLFHATVRDNMTFFNRDISDTRILKVVEELGLSQWFAMFPEGLDTMLTSGGTGLSAGEAQLLALVRAFLQNPGLVVLDEPSSRLDPATERLMDQAMARLLEGRTAIIIAHRLATVERADNIIILDHGRILEQGPRAQLAHDPASRFYRLLQTNLAEVV